MSLRILFAGTPQFAVPTLQALINSEHQVAAVFTQPDRPAGRGRKIHESPVKQLALAHKLPVFQPKSLQPLAEQHLIQDLQVDVMVVVAYGLLLPKGALQAPTHGCLNVHASLLPRWRGAAPIQYAILSGDQATGVTIMQMDAGLDTGDILLQQETPIAPQETSADLHERLSQLGAATLLRALQRLVKGDLQKTPQDDAKATLAPKIIKQQAELDWRDSAVALARKVRAFNPWPVAFTTLSHQLLRIHQAIALNEKVAEPAGCIVKAGAAGIDVATDDGILRLLQVQQPGGKVIAAKDFLNAKRDEIVVGKTYLLLTNT